MGKSPNFSDAFRFLWEHELRDQSVESQDPLILRSQNPLGTVETVLNTPTAQRREILALSCFSLTLYSLVVNKAVFQIKHGES